MNTMEAISWFCGLGGSALGAVLAGARVIAAIDYDDWMLASHELNMRDVKAVNFDMQRLAKLDPSTIALARDLLISFGIANPNTWEGTHVFTAPCPGFSKGGRMNPNDPRNRLIFAMIPILAATPKSRLIFENVPTFLAEKYKDIHTELFNGIRELRGYELDRHFLRRYVLYGPDYGLFQTRKRLIFPIMQNGESFPNPP
ncbi:MAG: DNA cytosine methyltransferase, partial [Planctomycetota bacterium]